MPDRNQPTENNPENLQDGTPASGNARQQQDRVQQLQQARQAQQTQPSEPQGQTPGYVTQEYFDQALSRIESMLQSSRDRTVNRLRDLLEERESVLMRKVEEARQSGVDITDDDVKAAREKIRAEVLATSSQGVSDQDTGRDNVERNQPTPQELQQGALEAQKISLKYNFFVEPGDPEYKNINRGFPTKQAMLDAVDQAHRAKANRLGLSVPQETSDKPVPPAERSPSVGTGGSPPGNSIQDITDPSELFKIYKQSKG